MGAREGKEDGSVVGTADGEKVGIAVGNDVGCRVGLGRFSSRRQRVERTVEYSRYYTWH